MERDDRWVRIIFERPHDLHLVPSVPQVSHNHTSMTRCHMITYNDCTLAIVVEELVRCTSFTAIFTSCTPSGSLADRDFDLYLGRHNHTEPQLPKPIYPCVISTLSGQRQSGLTSLTNCNLSESTWSEREKISDALDDGCEGLEAIVALI
jgi:hypothetical protein